MRAPSMSWAAAFTAVALGFTTAAVGGHAAEGGHRVLLQGQGRLAILAADGSTEWQMPWGPVHDLHVLPGGNIMLQQGKAKIVEIDRDTKRVVWSYDAARENGNAGKPVEVHSFVPLENDRIAIAETVSQRIIEIDRDGRLLKQIALQVDHPHPHTDTRLMRRTPQGDYLVCHEADGVVRQYDGQSGEVEWEYQVPLFGRSVADGHGPEAFGNKLFAALRMANGNTLISTGNGHSVLEVTPEKEIVWQLHQKDLPGITLAWVTTIEVLASGNYVIGNCHAGAENPLLIEIEPETRRVVWTLDRFNDFGNNVSNAMVLDEPRARHR